MLFIVRADFRGTQTSLPSLRVPDAGVSYGNASSFRQDGAATTSSLAIRLASRRPALSCLPPRSRPGLRAFRPLEQSVPPLHHTQRTHSSRAWALPLPTSEDALMPTIARKSTTMISLSQACRARPTLFIYCPSCLHEDQGHKKTLRPQHKAWG